MSNIPHAGDALWVLHAGLTYCEEHGINAYVIEHLREAARTIGAHMSVPEPMLVDSQALIKVLEAISGQPAPEKAKKRSGGRWGDPERIEHAKTLLDAMVSSDLFDWADMIADIHGKLQGDDPFATDRQLRAVCNIAKKGKYEDDSSFWEEFEDAYPETATFVEKCADSA